MQKKSVYHSYVVCLILTIVLKSKGFLHCICSKHLHQTCVQKAEISCDLCLVTSHWAALMVKIVL